MASWAIALLVAGVSLALVFFTYFACQAMLQMEQVLPRWAKEQGLRIIPREPRTIFRGTYFFSNRYKLVYHVEVEDQEGRQKKGWVCVGWWCIVGFSENVEVRWKD
jgi:hypothetical protein